MDTAVPPRAREGSDPVQHSWPDLTCYGCGPANDEGLHLRSYPGADGETLVARVDPDERFNAGAPNVTYGGHVASLVDCHSIWTAITFAYCAEGRPLGSDPRIAYVTSELCVDYRAPTPLDRPVDLTARVDGRVGKRTRVTTELVPAGDADPTATGEVVAVRVPAPEVGADGHGRERRE